ncbi:Gamma-interferon-inducible lysosomal thiol reductase [Sarcoptes scabiei]|nr:Gamma-interferon-inducible lysosomal thiol reductase [Sarcoptes scabiei]
MMASSSQNRLMPSLSNSGDIALWLHNKLSSDDIWSDKNSIITQLNADILRNIKTCFTGLHNNVKLKLLLSFLHIAKRNVEEWSNELNNLIQIAENDSNPWVKAIAEFLLQYPQKGTINIDDSNFSEIIFYLKKCGRS